MFSDPLTVTYNGSSKSLARVGTSVLSPGKTVSSSHYSTADEEFSLYIRETWKAAEMMRRFEVTLGRTQLDVDGPFVGAYSAFPNRFGFIYEANSLRYATSTDIPLLKTALTSLVDAAFQGRILGGEK